MVMLPSVGDVRPFRHRRRVDFPAPDSPSRTTNSPSGISNETSTSALLGVLVDEVALLRVQQCLTHAVALVGLPVASRENRRSRNRVGGLKQVQLRVLAPGVVDAGVDIFDSLGQLVLRNVGDGRERSRAGGLHGVAVDERLAGGRVVGPLARKVLRVALRCVADVESRLAEHVQREQRSARRKRVGEGYGLAFQVADLADVVGVLRREEREVLRGTVRDSDAHDVRRVFLLPRDGDGRRRVGDVRLSALERLQDRRVVFRHVRLDRDVRFLLEVVEQRFVLLLDVDVRLCGREEEVHFFSTTSATASTESTDTTCRSGEPDRTDCASRFEEFPSVYHDRIILTVRHAPVKSSYFFYIIPRT